MIFLFQGYRGPAGPVGPPGFEGDKVRKKELLNILNHGHLAFKQEDTRKEF